MRNPEELAVFRLADELALMVIKTVKPWPGGAFPADERFGLCQQIRRAAVSVASNIVEGCSRESQADFRRFIEIATGSAMELRYQLSLCIRAEYGIVDDVRNLERQANALTKSLIALSKTLRA